MQPAFLIAALVLLLAPNLAAKPDDPVSIIWSQAFEALLLLALIIAPASPSGTTENGRDRKNLTILLVGFPAWITLSLVARVAGHHGSLAYVDVMLRGVTYFTSFIALFELCRRAVQFGPAQRLLLLVAMIAGSSVVSGIGINEYLTHLRLGESTWRVFSLSSPDFLAGYLVMVVPVTLALMLAGPRSITTYAPLGLCLILQIGTILTTASRFALVSVAVSLIVFGALSIYSRSKQGGEQEKPKYGLLGGGLVAFLALCLLVTPIRKRLLHPDQNSAAFRLWTWKGTGHMIAGHPLFGSGIATYVFTYPVYALTGFTRLAHESYLQIAAEAGIPAVLILAALFVLAIVIGIRNLILASPSEAQETWNQRIISCGIIAAGVAGLVQNFIDSDFYLFSCGSALFAVLGMCAGIKQTTAPEQTTEKAPERRRRSAVAVQNQLKEPWTAPRIATAAIASILCLLASLNSLGGWDAYRGKLALGNHDQGTEAASDYQAAMQVSPLNGQYPSDFGYNVTFGMGNNPAGAENDLRNAVSLQPDEVSYRRLSQILEAEGKANLALEALDSGLRQSPDDLNLLLRRAQKGPPQDALQWYQKIADLETSPVGTVRALDAIEVSFAMADANIADADLQAGNQQGALAYYKRTASTLQAYFKRGGGHDPQQMILAGGFDTNRESMLHDLLEHSTSQIQVLQANTKAPDQSTVR